MKIVIDELKRLSKINLTHLLRKFKALGIMRQHLSL